MAVRGRTGVFPHRIDQTTDCNAMVDYEHREVHMGDAFYVTRVVALNNGELMSLRFQTPATAEWIHIVWAIESQAQMTIELRETITDNLEGTTRFNRNRNYSDALATMLYDPQALAAANGTVIYTWKSGGAAATPARGGSPGGARASGEIVLKSNTKYEWRITSLVDANTISAYLTWYEHTNVEN